VSNIAYVTYEVDHDVQDLNSYWQQLPPTVGTAVNTAENTLQISVPGSGGGNEWAGLCTQGSIPAMMTIGFAATQLDPGGASSGSNNMWAGIQLSSVVPNPSFTNGDPTHNFYITLRLAVEQGSLLFGYNVGSGFVTVGSGTYDPINHKFIRIFANFNNSNFQAQTSADGITWANQWTGAGAAFTAFGSSAPYVELVNYSAGSVASTAVFSNYTIGFQYPGGAGAAAAGIEVPFTYDSSVPATSLVSASVVVLSSTNSVVAATGDGLPVRITSPINYGDSPELIRENLANAVRAALGDYSTEIIFV